MKNNKSSVAYVKTEEINIPEWPHYSRLDSSITTSTEEAKLYSCNLLTTFKGVVIRGTSSERESEDDAFNVAYENIFSLVSKEKDRKKITNNDEMFKELLENDELPNLSETYEEKKAREEREYMNKCNEEYVGGLKEGLKTLDAVTLEKTTQSKLTDDFVKENNRLPGYGSFYNFFVFNGICWIDYSLDSASHIHNIKQHQKQMAESWTEINKIVEKMEENGRIKKDEE